MTGRARFTLGLAEGFYGVFYTFPERIDLIRFLGQQGYNLYLYGPKNDRQHRIHWWEPYPSRLMEQFAETVQVAEQSGLEFCYGISPGASICYSSPAEFGHLVDKLSTFQAVGVRSFCLMLDDNEPGFRHAEDAQAYSSLPEAQADQANRLQAALLEIDSICTLSFVPGEYWGSAPFSPSLVDLAARLDPRIDLFYTGPEICSPSITAADASSFASATGRVPLIWDNYPVNDLAMQSELHLGPLTGRSADMVRSVKGMVFNPMIQAEASKIPLWTAAAFCADPLGYDPAHAWSEAIQAVAGEAYAAQVRLLAENTNVSCLWTSRRVLDRLACASVEALQNGAPLDSPAVAELEAYLTEIDEAGYALKFRMENLALRNNLLPWIEVLEHWMWMARFALKVLRALEAGQDYLPALKRVTEYRGMIETHPKRAASPSLLQLVDFTITRVEQDQQKRVQSVNIPVTS